MTDAIIRKIRALRAKTIVAGATEAEADAAASLAQRLMAEHQIDETGIAAADYGVVMLDVKGIRLSMAQSHPCVYAGPGIMHISGTRLYGTHGRGISCVGDAVGREIAAYLFDLVYAALEGGWKRERINRREKAEALWQRTVDRQVADGKMRRSLAALIRDKIDLSDRALIATLRDLGIAWTAREKKSFMTGMADRMARRMRAMPPARAVPDDVVARLTSDFEMKRQREGKPRPRQFDAGSMLAGMRAGNEAAISMGVRDGGAHVPQLTKGEA